VRARIFGLGHLRIVRARIRPFQGDGVGGSLCARLALGGSKSRNHGFEAHVGQNGDLAPGDRIRSPGARWAPRDRGGIGPSPRPIRTNLKSPGARRRRKAVRGRCARGVDFWVPPKTNFLIWHRVAVRPPGGRWRIWTFLSRRGKIRGVPVRGGAWPWRQIFGLTAIFRPFWSLNVYIVLILVLRIYPVDSVVKIRFSPLAPKGAQIRPLLEKSEK